MKKITWVNFLHIYQPPWQDEGLIHKVAIESYDYLLTLLEKYAELKVSFSITGNLVDQLHDLRPDLLKRLQKLVTRGRVELVATAKYHPILPLLSLSEARRQIELNQKTLKQYFDIKKIRGFYLPEMAYSDAIAKIVKSMGFEWLILDPICYAGQVDNSILYQAKKSGLKIVWRDRKISKGYPPEIIFHKFKKIKNSETIITATDGEIYGHFHNDWQGHIEKILLNSDLRVLTVSQYLKNLKTKKIIALRPASWESSQAELKNKLPYALWQSPKNNIQEILWQLLHLADKIVNKHKADKNWYFARQHLDCGLSSCSFWWASGRRPSAFSPITWSPDMIEAGARELVRAVRSLRSIPIKDKLLAEKLYLEILKNIWVKHWKKYYKSYDQKNS